MFRSRLVATVVATLLIASAVPVPTAAASGESSAYAGTHVSFDVTGNAVTNYTVDGTTVIDSVAVASAESAGNSGIDLGGSPSAVTRLDVAGLSLSTQTDARATVETGGSATLSAHDNARGSLVVATGGSDHYVVANVSSDAETTAEGSSQVEVTTSSDTQGTFVVVGEGNVTVNDAGNVTASLASESRLVFRAYADGREDADETEEELIANGTATAAVYVTDQGGETVSDTVAYSGDTTVEVTSTAEGEVTMTASRATSQGTVVLASVNESVVGAAEDVEVSVDGEAAAEASSYAALASAASSGDGGAKFLARQSASAEATADVAVALDHFSDREVTVSDGSGSDQNDTEQDGENDTTSGDGVPGFTVTGALVALVAAGAFASRRV